MRKRILLIIFSGMLLSLTGCKKEQTSIELSSEKWDTETVFLEDAVTTRMMLESENGIYDCIDSTLLEYMQCADIMCLNNEFAYSTNGEPLAGKMYTFRGNPEYVKVLHQMGVDVVNLANNHVYDYGKQAQLDTFETLEKADLPYIGAGRSLDQAMEPYYVEIEGKRLAFVAASRAEKNKKTPQATESTSACFARDGVLRWKTNHI